MTRTLLLDWHFKSKLAQTNSSKLLHAMHMQYCCEELPDHVT